MIKDKEILKKETCEMCGTKFFGTGGMCSTECSEEWIKTNINGPWNKNNEDGETDKRD